jgi:hypothetical protein
MKVIAYVKARIGEHSTWASIVLAVTGGAALASPYSWLAIAAGVIGALVPTGRGK